MRAAVGSADEELKGAVAMGQERSFVRDLFLLIPEPAGGVKRRHKLLRRRRFHEPANRRAADIPTAPRCRSLRLGDDAAVDVAHALHAAERHGYVELAG